ncbi:MAG: phosphoribosylformylglycinamidine synthase subunit PurS [Acidobacteriota bacterium]
MSKKKQFKARVRVVPRPEILDPQGKAVAASLGRIGFDQVTEVRVGKSFDISLGAKNAGEARKALEAMADKLLANDVVEDFEVEILDGDAA